MISNRNCETHAMGVNDGGGGGGQSAPRRERRLFQEIEETPPGETISNIRLALTLLDMTLVSVPK